MEEAKKSPHPDLKDFWTDIYVSAFLYVFVVDRVDGFVAVQGNGTTLYAGKGERGSSSLFQLEFSIARWVTLGYDAMSLYASDRSPRQSVYRTHDSWFGLRIKAMSIAIVPSQPLSSWT